MSRYDFSDRIPLGAQREQGVFDHSPFSVSLASDRRHSLMDPSDTMGSYGHSIDALAGHDPRQNEQDWGPLDLEAIGSCRDGLWTRLSDSQSRHGHGHGHGHSQSQLYSPTSVSPQSQSRLAAFAQASSPVSFAHHRAQFSPGSAGSHLFGLQQQHQAHFTTSSSDPADPLLQSATARSLPNNQSGLPLAFVDTSFGSHQRTSLGGQTHQPAQPLSSLRSTLWWGELEPWMDEEYARQVCGLMGWDQVNVTIPQPSSDSAQSQQANNPGYCFLTFPSPQHAAAVLAQINNAAIASGTQPILPNSNKPFVLNWATSPPTSPVTHNYPVQSQVASSTSRNPAPPADIHSPSSTTTSGQAQNQNQKEYSIFVGDLAPETSNSDLVAVFRNPVLGLRNDRAPKFIRPFYSCKSAKIMLDPVTGVSRGYGFVRFTEEADQQRALIEMHGLYCLSRPMRISPATAKFKTIGNADGDAVNAPMSNPRSGSSLGSSNSIPSLTASTTASSMSSNGQPTMTIEALAQLIANASLGDSQNGKGTPSITAPLVMDQRKLDESLKHQEQARAILGNLVGPNGEQLTSTDPYNTTVFVGGLSPLISEETLRTFFAPFGDIHYVKVPAGKHCGFVQFVRKADAERAIERMQGFPIGGSRIRLSWGRSQYKAAQAAAQAAAAAQAQATQPTAVREASALTPEQAMEILQKLGYSGVLPTANAQTETSNRPAPTQTEGPVHAPSSKEVSFESSYHGSYPTATSESRFGNGEKSASRPSSGFSPFSPDPNYLANLIAEREASTGRDNGLRGAKGLPQRFGEISLSRDTSSGGISSRSTTPSGTLQKDAFLNSGIAVGPTKDGPVRSSSGQSRIDSASEVIGIGSRSSQVWESGADMLRSPTSTDDSNGSVQFRMTMGTSPTAPTSSP